MGYSTEFKGVFNLDKELTQEHSEYLKAFALTRRMKRDEIKLSDYPDPVREKVNLPIGKDGAYYVGGGGFRGQDDDDNILDYNKPPGQVHYETNNIIKDVQRTISENEKRKKEGLCQPSLWCKWVPTSNGMGIEWSEEEKFYDYIDWIKYLISHFLKPWGYTLNGKVKWQGERMEDRGIIMIADNTVTTRNLE